MARTDTTKDTTTPTIRMISSVELKAKPNLTSFRRLAPNITGIARKKVNSAATVRDVPARIPPIMVDPERDVPGITEAADDQRCLKGKLIQSGAGWSAAFVVVLDNDKKHTINDQHDGNDHIVVKFLFNNVIKRKSDDDRRQTCYQDLKPEDPLILITVFFYKSKDSSGYCRLFTQCHLCFLRDFSYVKRPQLVPVQYNNCQNRAKLDHHQEKFHKCLGYIQLDKLIHKDHMSGTTDRKPLGDSLHNTEKDNLQ